MSGSDGEEEIKRYFSSLNLPLSDSWVSSLKTHSSSRLTKESCTRAFLASNITHSLNPSLAPCYDEPRTNPTCVQVLSCLEIGSSLFSLQQQLEEYRERQKPLHRRLVSLQDSEEPDVESTVPTATIASGKDEFVSKKMSRVVLQDARGDTMYGIDVVSIPELKMGMTLGSKLLLYDVSIVHNVLILKPDKVQWLGGHIDALNHSPATSLGGSGRGNDGLLVARLAQDLEARLAQFPIMTIRDRQRAVADQTRQDEQDDGVDGYNQDNAGHSAQDDTRGRGGRGRARTRARGGRARGR